VKAMPRKSVHGAMERRFTVNLQRVATRGVKL